MKLPKRELIPSGILKKARSFTAAAAAPLTRRCARVCLYSLIAVTSFYFLEQYLSHLTYAQSSCLKMTIFLAAMLLYCVSYDEMDFFKRLFQPSRFRNEYRRGLFWGVLAAVSILGASAAFMLYIDSGSVRAQIMSATYRSANYALASLYVIFVNTLLEEVFFRGFVFLRLYRSGNTVFAYLFSALLFALYHAYIFTATFSPPLIVITIFGLFLSGLLLCYLNARANNIFNGWITHTIASAAIMIVGFCLGNR